MTLNSIKNSKKDNNLVARTVPSTGLDPFQIRKDPDRESQRSTAVNIVTNNASLIREASQRFNVKGTAIATAIIWEGAENYQWLRPGVPGRFHDDVARNLYSKDQRIPRDYTPDRMSEPKVAIVYIAAMMDEHCRSYKNIAGVSIRNDGAIQAQLYQQGNSQQTARKLRDNRKKDREAGLPERPPRVPTGINGMGEYHENHGQYFLNLVYPGNRSTLNPLPETGNSEVASKSMMKKSVTDSIEHQGSADSRVEVSNVVNSSSSKNQIVTPQESDPRSDLSKVVEILRNNSDAVKQNYGLDVNTSEGLGKAVMQYWQENNLDPKTLRDQLPGIKDSEFEAVTNTTVAQSMKTDQRAM